MILLVLAMMLEVAVREGQSNVRVEIFMQIASARGIRVLGISWKGEGIKSGVADFLGQVFL